MSKFCVLENNRIDRILVSDDQTRLAFVTANGTFAFDTDADCCSETWFADITGVKFLLGHSIHDAEEYYLPDDPEDGRSRQESDQVMGVKLKTWQGVCVIEYRNSSNGYYGGSISNVFVPDSLDGWTEITEDWHA